MSTSSVNVRIDGALKQQAEELFSDLGLSMSSAISIFLRSAVNHNGIPFEIKRNPYNAVTRAALAEYEEMRENPDKYKRYDSAADAFRDVLDDA